MGDMDMLEIIIEVLAGLAFIGYFGAGVAYGVLAPWYDSRLGRWLMFVLGSIAATLFLILLLLFIPAPDRQTLRLIIYGTFALAGNGVFISIVHEQLKNRRAAKRKSSPPTGELPQLIE